MKLTPFILFSFFISTVVNADAGVDGFFREDLVKEGVFPGQKQKVGENFPYDEHSEPEGFFISREERRRNPEKAPSNQIKVDSNRTIKIRNRSIHIPESWVR